MSRISEITSALDRFAAAVEVASMVRTRVTYAESPVSASWSVFDSLTGEHLHVLLSLAPGSHLHLATITSDGVFYGPNTVDGFIHSVDSRTQELGNYRV